jgi:hypothetical protein
MLECPHDYCITARDQRSPHLLWVRQDKESILQAHFGSSGVCRYVGRLTLLSSQNMCSLHSFIVIHNCGGCLIICSRALSIVNIQTSAILHSTQALLHVASGTIFGFEQDVRREGYSRSVDNLELLPHHNILTVIRFSCS